MIEEDEYEEQAPTNPIIKIEKPIIDKFVMQLSYDEGQDIRDLIQDKYLNTFPYYCRLVGVKTPNFYNATNGERPCTLEWLNKLLSGIEYEAVLTNPEIVIRPQKIGRAVPDVDYLEQEGELPYNGQEELDKPD